MDEAKLNKKIHQYHQISNTVKALTELREKLNKQIKKAIIEQHEPVDDGTVLYHYTDKGFKASITVRKSHQINDHKLEEILVQKGLLGEATREIIDHDYVERLFLLEKLSDSDLRKFKEAKYQLSLSVEKRDEESV